jgi:hypothetical protein
MLQSTGVFQVVIVRSIRDRAPSLRPRFVVRVLPIHRRSVDTMVQHVSPIEADIAAWLKYVETDRGCGRQRDPEGAPAFSTYSKLVSELRGQGSNSSPASHPYSFIFLEFHDFRSWQQCEMICKCHKSPWRLQTQHPFFIMFSARCGCRARSITLGRNLRVPIPEVFSSNRMRAFGITRR